MDAGGPRAGSMAHCPPVYTIIGGPGWTLIIAITHTSAAVTGELTSADQLTGECKHTTV